MNQDVTSTINSNLSITDSSLQDPITVAIPPPLTPEQVPEVKQLAEQLQHQQLLDILPTTDDKPLPLKQLPESLSALALDGDTIEALGLELDTLAIEDITTQQSLTEQDFDVDWGQSIDDACLEQFINQGFVVLDNVYQPKALLALQAESGFIDYRDAKLTEGVRLSNIRGDRIRWITKHFFAGYYYLQSINELAHLFNRLFFAGIRHSEAHYACYPPGFGYKWHSDNPVGRDERVISAVFYLNDEWTIEDGGALSLIDMQNEQHQLLPKANRLVIFDSNLQHQVEIAHRQRYSIATWLRRDDAVFIPEP
ncbi:2OG-Fe(II) oxygenase [Psychrobacter sp. FDAARGOS_221]|uniref:2OG-Fe(II) oxygenase n=1 Tax=Psychrobacter sp. FDAARGOS_221 TaxID=1975705 RepID=UPI000BB5938B|nr:2OG-Fe(II) oxygenase [Psychrobacter sp. FDAARGOS_221]PNK60113.1 2OG-Fe(II) oxygenase [Psychrobacter sp. FDAARGOS_221]